MPTLKIKNIPGYDGEYTYEQDDLTTGEIAEIEATSGVPFAKWSQGFVSVFIGLAAVLIKRAGKPLVIDMLHAAKPDSFELVDDEVSIPPPVTPSVQPSTDGEKTSKGSNGSEPSSANQAADREPSGSRG